MQTLPVNRDATASRDIDWELLLLLARTEAALTWPEPANDATRITALPDGLDLRHGADLDWVSRLAAADDYTPPHLATKSLKLP